MKMKTLAVIAALSVACVGLQANDALMMYVLPTASYVLLHCADSEDCEARLTCYDRAGQDYDLDPVTVESRHNHQVRLYDGLQAAGMAETDLNRRTTCETRSDQNLHVRAYTRFGGTLLPVHGLLGAEAPAAPGPGVEPPPPDGSLVAPTSIVASLVPCDGFFCGGRTHDVRLIWHRPSGGRFTRVYRHTTSSFAASSQITMATFDQYNDTDVENGQTYYYWFRAENLTGVQSPVAGPVRVRLPSG